MKILLTTLNSKYVHSNLAIKYLYTVVADEYSGVDIREFTINNDLDYVYQEIVRANYDVVCFSCYVWNIEKIKILGRDLKSAMPHMKILLGGPEVSYRSHEFMRENPWIDYILRGEGEYEFYRFCQVINDWGKRFDTVPGLIYKEDGKLYVNHQTEPMNMNSIPFPYSILDCEEDKVVYYESTRGCPFNCSYCLSSIDKTMRVLNVERVKRELGYFLHKNVMQVKFIDRTFNFNKERTLEILNYIVNNDNGVTNFHFEICADLLDGEVIDILKKSRSGLFQLEVGIQSTHAETLRTINRKDRVGLVLKNVEKLTKLSNLHVHVDLIAGLPFETYEIFKKSFNQVYALRADALQLGFLKVLKGTAIERETEKYGIIYRHHAPYEVISTDFISARELVKLKAVENMVDLFYNRKGYSHTLEYLIGAFGGDAFVFFETLGEFYYGNGYQNRDRKKEDQYRVMAKFGKYLEENGRLPEGESILRGILDRDLQETMKPENYKRFMRKGWELKWK